MISFVHFCTINQLLNIFYIALFQVLYMIQGDTVECRPIIFNDNQLQVYDMVDHIVRRLKKLMYNVKTCQQFIFFYEKEDFRQIVTFFVTFFYFDHTLLPPDYQNNVSWAVLCILITTRIYKFPIIQSNSLVEQIIGPTVHQFRKLSIFILGQAYVPKYGNGRGILSQINQGIFMDS